MQLQEGRPQNMAERPENERRSYELLDALGVPYQRVEHPPAATMEACAAIDRVLGASICKNLFLCNRQQTAFYLLMMPDDKPFKTRELSAQIGAARLSFASPETMQALLGVTPGSVSVLGLMNDTERRVQLLMDEEVLAADFFGCHPCVNTASLRLSTRALTEQILPALRHAPRLVRLPRDPQGGENA